MANLERSTLWGSVQGDIGGSIRMYDNQYQQQPPRNRFRRYRPLIVFIIIVAIIFYVEDQYTSPVQENVTFAEGTVGDVSEIKCPFPLNGDNHITCYHLITEQNHAAPDGNLLSILAVKIDPLPEQGEEKPDLRADPFLYLEGGPGYGAIYGDPGDFGTEGVMRKFYAPILQTGRSLIAVDTRGLGFSRPALSCPASNKVSWQYLMASPESRDDEKVLATDRACLQSLQDAGIDFGQYNSASTAKDLALLRKGLGIQQWNIYGVSYGAQTALQLLRHDREGVRRVIFDSPSYAHVTPWQDDEAAFIRILKQLDNYCAEKKVGDDETYCPAIKAQETVTERLDRVLAKLQKEPIILRNLSFERPVHMSDREAISLLHGSLYSESGFEDFLWDLEDFAAFENGLMASFSELAAYWRKILYYNYFDPLSSWVVQYATSCTEMNYDAESAQTAYVYSPEEIDFSRRICDQMGLSFNGENINASEFTGVPSLTLSGHRDVITPPDYGRELAEDIDGLWLLKLEGAHGIAFAEGADCIKEVMSAFLNDAGKAEQAGCLAENTALELVAN
jgi:pimeloyl-ACP methyl ester carboxylesterase